MATTAFFLVIVASLNGLAQTVEAQSANPSFETASVRLFAEAANNLGPRIRTSPDSLTIHGSSLRDCIQVAYRLPAPQVIGPNWLNDVRLDIVAKAAGPVDEEQLYLMLRVLLAERLGVKAHLERKERSVLALTLAKGAPKFSESTADGPPLAQGRNGTLEMQRISMSEFAAGLSQQLHQPVVDATGLKGRYDLHMDMTQYMPTAATDGNLGSPSDPTSIMITALQEQLGLKMEVRKDTIEVLTVDHAEKAPTAN